MNKAAELGRTAQQARSDPGPGPMAYSPNMTSTTYATDVKLIADMIRDEKPRAASRSDASAVMLSGVIPPSGTDCTFLIRSEGDHPHKVDYTCHML